METIIYFALAVLIIARLYNSLGKFTDSDTVVKANSTKEHGIVTIDAIVEPPPHEEEITSSMVCDGASLSEIKQGIQDIKKYDSSFAAGKFLHCADAAFESIVNAFLSKNMDLLKQLVHKDLLEKFIHNMESSDEEKLQKHQEIISIKSLLHTISIHEQIASITVSFATEQRIFSLKNDELVSGSKTRSRTCKDLWTFSRNLKSSSNKMWVLEKMDKH